jgi:hypothetical protein
MVSQLALQRGVDHPTGQLGEQPARTGDLIRIKAPQGVLKLISGQQARQAINELLGHVIRHHVDGGGLRCLWGHGGPFKARPPRSAQPPRPPGSTSSRTAAPGRVRYPDLTQNIGQNLAETTLAGFRLIVRRTRLIGDQAELWPDWRYHTFATNRTVPTPVADIDHRDHASVELTIRDLKDQALRHFPSGCYHANSAWTVIAALAHNIARWTTLIGLPTTPVQTAEVRRRRLLQIPGRMTHTSRRWTLRLPARWPWKTDFITVLDAIRALPTRA